MAQRRFASQGSGKGKGGTRTTVILIAVIVVAIAAGGVAYWKYQQYLNQEYLRQVSETLDIDTFYDGVFVDGVPLGGLTPDEARARIREKQQPLLDAISVGIRVGEATTRFTAEDMTVTFDTEQVLEKAWNTGRQGSRDSRYEYVKALPENPAEFTTSMTIDPSPIESRVMALSAFYDADPIDAAITQFNPDAAATVRFMYSPEQYGVRVDTQSAWQQVRSLVEARQWGQTVEVASSQIAPQITMEALKANTQLICHFETRMTNDKNRIHNINLAMSHLSGTVIMPGEEFSFNATTGPRTYATGYKDAGIILSGQPDQGVAGGVCQVSGTLFNALVMADLEITDRSHHSYELGYLKRGRDATVDYPSGTDLKCKNNHATPVYIIMYTTDDRRVVAEVYGAPLPDGLSIDIGVKTLDEHPPTDPPQVIPDAEVPVGQPRVVDPHNYIKCQSYKVYKDAQGNVVRREELILDVYRAITKRTYINPADLVTPKPTPATTPEPTAAPTEE
ncbi:MAG: hypothetical protein GX549_02365 [Clostridiales bacterium]|nr:hypothetical protein [Clostridiales bacterium]